MPSWIAPEVLALSVSNWQTLSPAALMLGLSATLLFALIAWGIRAVTIGGAISGALLTSVIFAGAGFAGLAAVIGVFVLTAIATSTGYKRKQKLGAQEHAGGRTARQIFANLGAAAMLAAPAAHDRHVAPIFLAGMTAALAEAAADTMSSEIGQAVAGRTVLVTNWRREVWIGRNGGVSRSGTAAGITGAVLVAFVCAFGGLLSWKWAVASALFGIAGMFFDSFLGATLERPGRLGNDSVNFLGTVFAAFLATAFAFISL